jgi:hypothetical protein
MREEMVIPTTIGRGWLIGRVQDESVGDYSPRGKKPEKKTGRGKSNQKGNTNSGEMRCGMRSGEMSWLISDRGEGSTRLNSQSSTAMAPKAPMMSGAPLLANGFALEVNPVVVDNDRCTSEIHKASRTQRRASVISARSHSAVRSRARDPTK